MRTEAITILIVGIVLLSGFLYAFILSQFEEFRYKENPNIKCTCKADEGFWSEDMLKYGNYCDIWCPKNGGYR